MADTSVSAISYIKFPFYITVLRVTLRIPYFFIFVKEIFSNTLFLNYFSPILFYRRRFTAAKELLRFTIKPVKEIIDESGIGNDDLFRRLFQDGEGMTAEEYRMKWAQWVK